MPDRATRRNRLDEAASPYLLEHADNPVHWQPWDETTLAAANERDVPLFVSIGYAACHWCHVMADESFANETVAEVLNSHFVPIKVDREERPDLDRFYQTACQATGRGGGWPLSVWATPDGRPFQVATYLPRIPRRGMPGFIDILERIAEAWQTDRAAIESRADELTASVRDSRQVQSSTPLEPAGRGDVLSSVAQDVLRLVDHDQGGFGSRGPKFPHVPRLDLLLRSWRVTGRTACREALVVTLDGMVDGGMHDHIGGGFHRYSTDQAWSIPHFEKMAYDNVALLGHLAAAGHQFDHEPYRTAARRTAAFITDELGHPAGGVYCSLDADTGGEEGATYVWTADSVAEVIDDPIRRQLIVARYGLEGTPEVAGGRVPRVSNTVADLSETFDLGVEEVTERLDRGREQLLAARHDRPQPTRDEKIIASWNGLAVAGFVRAGVALDEPTYLETATNILAFVEDELVDDGRLWRRYRDGDVAVSGFLEDYASVASGAFDLASSTGSRSALTLGIGLARELLDRFWDADDEGLSFTDGTETVPPTDPLDARDRSLPSAVALTVEALGSAAGFLEDDRLPEAIRCIEANYGGQLAAGGIDKAGLALALDRWAHGPPSVTAAGGSLDSERRRILRTQPRRPMVTERPADVDTEAAALGLETVPPLWRDRTPVDGELTLYPCRGRVCGPPASDTDAALSWFTTDEEE